MIIGALALPILLAGGVAGRADPVIDRMAMALVELDAISAADLPLERRAEAFLQIVEDAFDLDSMADASLGRDALPDHGDWADYLNAYRSHVIQSFLQKLRIHGPTQSTPIGLRQADYGASVFIFRSRAGGQSVRIGWVLCPHDTSRVCDIEVFGTPMLDSC